jgi:acyl-CoA thioesterase FadM
MSPTTSLKSSISMKTRICDLDSLRHVNNRIYEQLCAEGRFRLLEKQGYSIEALLDKAFSLRPMASFVRFSLQQKSGSTLNIETEAFPLGNGIILWNHHITQPDGKNVCQLQAKSETLDRHHKPVELLPLADADPVQVLIENVPRFSGNCSRVSSSYRAIYTDMDTFGNLPFAAFWRIFEEGRHMFGEQLGFTLQKLVQFDTHIFWTSGTYQYYKPIKAGQQVSIFTWLERIVRIRAYIRQEIRSADGVDLLAASREEHLVVSLSQVRARELPSEMTTMLQAYTEYRD